MGIPDVRDRIILLELNIRNRFVTYAKIDCKDDLVFRT